MDGDIIKPDPAGDQTSSEEEVGRSSLRRRMRRALAALSLSKTSGAEERLEEFLSHEHENGEARSQEEREMLLNILRLRDVRVDDVMVPRADIVAIDRDASLDETLESFRSCSHSRLPVYRETLDDPVGVVHLKDLALSHGFGARQNDFSLGEHLRSVLVVPPSMRIQPLLQRMQATRRHMALVVDEYGGVDGLLTIEDVIEQIVGEIEDEHDVADRPLWRKQADGCFVADARAMVGDFEEAVSVKLLSDDGEEEVDTLGGLVFMLLGRVPERGEVIPHPNGHEFEIIDADPRRIKRVRVRLNARSAADPSEDKGNSDDNVVKLASAGG